MMTISDDDAISSYVSSNKHDSNIKAVLRVWLNGGIVQYRKESSSIWKDYDELNSNFNLLSSLYYFEWRIKPAVQVYRLAIIKDVQGIKVVAVNSLQSAEELENISWLFIKWLTDWVEYTSEN